MVRGQRLPVEDVLFADDLRLVSLTVCDPDAQVALYVGAEQSLIESGQVGPRRVTERGARNRLSWVQHDIEVGDAVGYAIHEDTAQGSMGEVIVTGLTSEAEIEYLLAPNARGKGIARRAVRAVVRHVFENYPVDDILFEIRYNNVPSQRVAEAVGAVKQPGNGSSRYETWRVGRG